MADFRRRHRLRRKNIEAVAARIEKGLDCPVFGPDEEVDEAEFRGSRILLVKGEILAMYLGDNPFLTVRGVLKYRPDKRAVTVDMGAVPYVYNGADVMAPGVVEADPTLREGDPCWVRDERNLAPLAVGVALMSGEEMTRGREGKAIKTHHSVGDRLWKLGERN